MGVSTSSKSSLFLIEMMLSILFLALASAVCVSMFVRATTMGEQSENLSAAVAHAQSVAESFKSCDGDVAALCELFDTADDGTGSVTIFYDNDWKQSKDEYAPYSVVVDIKGDSMKSAQIVVYHTGEKDPLWELHTEKYVPAPMPQ